jgi:hypothetical protein
MKKQDIDIAAGIQFSPTVSADRKQSYRGCAFCEGGAFKRTVKQVAQHHVQQSGSIPDNLKAARARRVFQTETVLFDLQKFFVKIQAFSEAPASLRCQLSFGVREDFLKMLHLGEKPKIHEFNAIA